MKNSGQVKGGFTLVEAIVSLVIFGICIGAFCELTVLLRQTSDKARDHYVAVNIAKNRLERARNYDFDALNGFTESQMVVDNSGNSSLGGDFRRSTSISTVSTNLKQVAVSVEIRDRITRRFGGESETATSYVPKYTTHP